MKNVSFDGRVALITGSGRGIGRGYANLLAERGATVVINDIGRDDDGTPRAQRAAQEIEAAGGSAMASLNDISSASECAELIETVRERFGRLDILILNAGLTHFAQREQSLVIAPTFSGADLETVRRQIELQVMGAFYLGQPSWRLMEEGGYGRIVLTASSAVFGYPGDGSYGAAKAAMLSLGRTMQWEADAKGVDIQVNVVSPSASTAPSHAAFEAGFGGRNSPAMVAGVVGYLASDACDFGGRCYRVGGSYVGFNYIGQTQGWVSTGPDAITPEDFAAHLPDIMELEDFVVPGSSTECMDFMMSRVHDAMA